MIDAQTDDQVTPSFALSEFARSDVATRWGIDNTPAPDVSATLRHVLIPAMQQVRDLLGVPVHITSGYRCLRLNAAVRGAQNSQHTTGNAADFVAPAYGPPRAICRLLVAHMATLQFDQLIFEGTWVHLSFSARRRLEVLTAHFDAGGVSCTRGLA